MHLPRLARPRSVLPAAALLLLGACDYFGGTSADTTDGEATGEVLPGSIDDAMIPTDDLTSQPPPLVQPTGGAAVSGDGVDSAESATAEPVAEETAPAEPEAAAE
jgi:hypothetical protein